tara:strand:+ start:335 stop:1225 length:891 start_codon:yes stop_codon:yes gene_type:complete
LNTPVEQFLDYVTLERGLSGNTRSAYEDDLTALHRFMEKRSVRQFNDLERKDVLEFLMAERERGLSVNSVSRRLVAIRVFFRYLQQESLLDRNVVEIMDSPKLAKILPGVLTSREVERLLDAPDLKEPRGVRDRTILELLYATGLRVSEAAALAVGDIQFDSDYLRCFGKGSKARVVPFGRQAKDFLTRYIDQVRPGFLRDDDAEGQLFLTRLGRGFTRQGLWRLVKGYAQSAGISKNVTPHTLRHSFASHMLANGAPLRIIQEILGHADIATTQVYTHVDEGRLRASHSQFHPRA